VAVALLPSVAARIVRSRRVEGLDALAILVTTVAALWSFGSGYSRYGLVLIPLSALLLAQGGSSSRSWLPRGGAAAVLAGGAAIGIWFGAGVDWGLRPSLLTEP